MWGHSPSDGHMHPFSVRLRMFVVLSLTLWYSPRFAGNVWLTSRRMARTVNVCDAGCCAMGGDCVRHYFACPVLADSIRLSRALPPSWLHTRHIGLVAFAVPLPEERGLQGGDMELHGLPGIYVGSAAECPGSARGGG